MTARISRDLNTSAIRCDIGSGKPAGTAETSGSRFAGTLGEHHAGNRSQHGDRATILSELSVVPASLTENDTAESAGIRAVFTPPATVARVYADPVGVEKGKRYGRFPR